MDLPMLKILILEDNADRQSAMISCLRDRFHQYESVFFVDANVMLAYLNDNLNQSLAISLDHDLELLNQHNGNMADPGTGRMIADYLADKAPVCPVIIATTNSNAGDAMEFLLRDANWETHRVYPWGDLEWIPSHWFRTLRDAVVGTARSRKSKLPTSSPAPAADPSRTPTPSADSESPDAASPRGDSSPPC
jgi:CheY-like chemotaxis protein